MTADGSTGWSLRLEGTLHGEWVNELRRAWRDLRHSQAGARISVMLADVPFVDPAGKMLLKEMQHQGVDLLSAADLQVL